MIALKEKKGIVLFCLILIIIAIISLAAFRMTGPMGIEDRYSTAVGLPATGDAGESTGSGFSIEGNPVLYVIVLAVLLAVGFIAYRYLPKPGEGPETGKKE